MITNEKFLNKLEKIAVNAVKILFLIIIWILFLYSIVGSAVVNAKEHTTYYKDNIFLNIIVIISICVIALLLKRKKVKISKPVLYGSIIIWFILCVFWLFLTRLQPRFDQKYILDIAMSIKDGDKSFCYKRFIL